MSEGAFTLIAVGDVCLGDHPIMVGRGPGSRIRGGTEARYPFSHAKPLLEGGGVLFCNLETPISQRGLREGVLDSMEMRGAPGGAARLAAAGFNVVNAANNHILQHGDAAYRETVASLEAHGIGVVGVAQSGTDACVRLERIVNGVRIAFVGYAFEPDRYYCGRPMYAFGPRCDLKAEIQSSRRTADVVVCSLHWGREFIRVPSQEMVQFARELVDAGASLVLGHHPHVFQGVERYRKGVIAYSLGNFVTDMPWDDALTCGLVLRCRISRAGVVEFETRFSIAGSDYQPRPASASEHATRLAELNALSRRLHDAPASAAYHEEADRLIKRNRLQSYRYFFRHLGDYPSGVASQILRRAVRRKVHDVVGHVGWHRKALRS